MSGERHADTFVVRILGDALGGDRIGVEDEPIGFAFHRAELLKDSNEAFRRVVSSGQEVGIPSGAISLFGPKLEQKRALEDENIPIAGAAEAVENSFEAIFDQEQSEIRIALASEIEQFLTDGSGNVFRGWVGQLERLQIRTHDIGDAADLGGGPEFVHRSLLRAAGFLQRFFRGYPAGLQPAVDSARPRSDRGPCAQRATHRGE
jgi:hypothetical protein